jgi:hypothetical protein
MTKVKDFPWYQRPSKFIYRCFKKQAGCSKQQASPSGGSAVASSAVGLEMNGSTSLERQLADTQKLLERYFNRCEVLESELAKYKK